MTDLPMVGYPPRVVAWVSGGAPSAVAAKLAIREWGDLVVCAYTDPGSEHPDNARFLNDCEEWLGVPVARLKSDRYADTWQVWKERRFLVGPTGALCTVEMKKKLRYAFQRPDDAQVFGYSIEEKGRVERFMAENPGVDLRCPLIDAGLTKNDCLAMIERAGIELPAMYRLGYHNANCIGCPKAGLGYWNKIRVDFPDTFARMAAQEREINHACHHNDAEGMIFLDELDPDRGDYPTEMSADCSLLCVLAEDVIAAQSDQSQSDATGVNRNVPLLADCDK